MSIKGKTWKDKDGRVRRYTKDAYHNEDGSSIYDGWKARQKAAKDNIGFASLVNKVTKQQGLVKVGVTLINGKWVDVYKS